MRLLLLQCVALLYVLVFYFRFKRWYRCSQSTCGRRRLRRLQRCAPQILLRAAHQQRQCLLLWVSCLERRQWLLYTFCYYYGGHAASTPAWLLAASTLYCLWNDMHASSIAACHVGSVIAFSSMARPFYYGPWMGLILGMLMPAFMPCQICPPERSPEGCIEVQRMHGCHSCGRRGCWHTNLLCFFFQRNREAHRDALMGDSAPHMRETHITCTADGTQMEGRLHINWWSRYHHVQFLVNDAQPFTMGRASGEECNCLIDTLRQQLHLECDIRAVRAYVFVICEEAYFISKPYVF